jgi:hypothetical protein
MFNAHLDTSPEEPGENVDPSDIEVAAKTIDHPFLDLAH